MAGGGSNPNAKSKATYVLAPRTPYTLSDRPFRPLARSAARTHNNTNIC